jgi:hypothetical protein
MTDELDSIILKPARWQLDDYLKAKKAIQALIAKECTKARLRGVEEVLLKLKQAPPIDWIDAQSWIDGEYARLQAQLKEENDCTCICHSPAYYAPHKTGHACCDEANVIEDNSLLVKTTNIIPPPDKEK